jgi:hypothetical protein
VEPLHALHELAQDFEQPPRFSQLKIIDHELFFHAMSFSVMSRCPTVPAGAGVTPTFLPATRPIVNQGN